jgi:hypothetical protein
VHHRPLAFVLALAAGDYLLWNWSVQGGHDVPALIAGLSLPPLAVAALWLLALNIVRLLARSAQQPRVRRTSLGAARSARRRAERIPIDGSTSASREEAQASSQGEPASSSKLAA